MRIIFLRATTLMSQPSDAALEHEESEFGLDELFPRNVHENYPMPADVERVTLLEEGRYAAYAYDLDFMWRWVIVRDGEEVQDGPAVSLSSARHSALHVLAFFRQRDKNKALA